MEKIVTGTIVILDRVKLTHALYLEKFALLDPNFTLNSDGSLPEGKYGEYYRVGLDCHNQGMQYITDWGGAGLCLEDRMKLIAFLAG